MGSITKQKVFEEVSGKNLKQFFDQWLYTTGQPELEISWEYSEIDKYYYVHMKQLQKKVFKSRLFKKWQRMLVLQMALFIITTKIEKWIALTNQIHLIFGALISKFVKYLPTNFFKRF